MMCVKRDVKRITKKNIVRKNSGGKHQVEEKDIKIILLEHHLREREIKAIKTNCF